MIALLGNVSRDLLPGRPSRPGGAPIHAARALRHLDAQAELYGRCAAADRDELLPPEPVPVPAPGAGSQPESWPPTEVRYVPGTRTASFELDYAGERRRITVRALGDRWLPSDLPALRREVRWVHVAPLLRGEFPAETLAAAARGRRLSLDGQGLVRPPRTGPLVLDADFDPDLLRHVRVLKLSAEEAAAVGDPLSLGVHELLVTEGSRGATVFWEGRAERVPAFEIGRGRERDPTGAGDAFCLGYLAARDLGLTPSVAARRATAVAAATLAG